MSHHAKSISNEATQLGQEQAVSLVWGSIYSGVIGDYDRDSETYMVDVDGQPLSCTYAAPTFCRLIGIQYKQILPAGTQVRVVYDTRPFIIGALPSNPADPGKQSANSSGSEAEPSFTHHSGHRGLHGEQPDQDQLEGELDMTNIMQSGIKLLTFMARLQSGERAVVETCVLNDMVRIVNDCFRHHSAFGDQLIYNDGRLNNVEHGTSYDHEAWGVLPEEGEALKKLDMVDGKVDLESVAETGRWRYSRFIGFLGDMVHMMVSDPTETLGQLAESALRAGKARVQIMNDGTLLAQSVSEICLERVSRITVPVQLKTDDDPDGVLSTEFEQLEQKFLKIWEGLTEDAEGPDLANMAYQLRSYARWMNSYHSLARFLQMGKDWKVPSESESPDPSWTNAEKDVERQNEKRMTSYDTYACFRIMRDGSIVIWAGDGSSMVMADRDIQLHAARHLDLFGAGDVRIRAGRDLHLEARRHTNLMSVVGGLRLKSRTYWEALCEQGSLWIKSDADPDVDPPEVPEGDPEPVVRKHAIILDSTKGRVLVNGQKQLMLNTESAPGEEETDFGITIQSGRAGLRLRSGDKLSLIGRTVETLASSIYSKCTTWLAEAASEFTVLNRFSHQGGTLKVDILRAQYLDAADGLMGPEASEGMKRRGIMVRTTPTTQDDTDVDAYPFKDREELDDLELSESLKVEEAFEKDEKWDYLPEDYAERVNNRETITEQYLQQDLPDSLGDDYASGNWGPNDTKLKSSTRTGAGTPYNNSTSESKQYRGGEDLRKPSTTNPADQAVKASTYDPKRSSWKYLKT